MRQTSYEIQQEQRNEALRALEVAKKIDEQKKYSRVKNWGAFDYKNKAHMQILSLLRNLNWTKSHIKYGEVGDTERLGKWLKSENSPVRKPLMRMNKQEVSKIICALEAMIIKKY